MANLKGLQARIFISRSAPCFDHLLKLPDDKSRRTRLNYLIGLGFDYEQKLLAGKLNSISPSQLLTSTNQDETINSTVTKKTANRTEELVQSRNNKFQIPAELTIESRFEF